MEVEAEEEQFLLASQAWGNYFVYRYLEEGEIGQFCLPPYKGIVYSTRIGF